MNGTSVVIASRLVVVGLTLQASVVAADRPRDLVVPKYQPHIVAIESTQSIRWRMAPVPPHTATQTADAQRVLERSGRGASWILPQRLPPLLVPADSQLRTIVGMCADLPQVRQLTFLERQSAILRGSIAPGDRQLGYRLRSYLKSYKSRWDKRWLGQRLEAFAHLVPLPVPDIDTTTCLNPQRAATVTRRVYEAWSILSRAVHPDRLEALGKLTIFVNSALQRPFAGTGQFVLPEDASVKDILHEFGHQLEHLGGFALFATAHAALVRRAFGSPLQPIARIGRDRRPPPIPEQAFAGAFFKRYLGKRYGNGATELVSLFTESLGSKRARRNFFHQDGELFLLLLSALQQPR